MWGEGEREKKHTQEIRNMQAEIGTAKTMPWRGDGRQKPLRNIVYLDYWLPHRLIAIITIIIGL